MDVDKLEELSQALVAAAARGDLEEAARLIAHRTTLIRELGALSDNTLGPRLERIRSSGDRAGAMLRAQRARDVMSIERMRQVGATSPVRPSNASIDCVG